MTFEEFWASYPKKGRKPEAKKAWDSLDESAREKAVHDLPREMRSDAWLRSGGSFIPYPGTYLKLYAGNTERPMDNNSTADIGVAFSFVKQAATNHLAEAEDRLNEGRKLVNQAIDVLTLIFANYPIESLSHAEAILGAASNIVFQARRKEMESVSE